MFVRHNYWLCALATVAIAASPALSQSVNTDPSRGRGAKPLSKDPPELLTGGWLEWNIRW